MNSSKLTDLVAENNSLTRLILRTADPEKDIFGRTENIYRV
jgi:hypothetical protein